jgi:hypothetical protein
VRWRFGIESRLADILPISLSQSAGHYFDAEKEQGEEKRAATEIGDDGRDSLLLHLSCPLLWIASNHEWTLMNTNFAWLLGRGRFLAS